jgi:nicotinate-nucleotide pyrophosphorylase (carboxylating)
MCSAREEQVRKALFRGDKLRPENLEYLQTVRIFVEELISSDLGPGDLTGRALGLADEHACARVLAKAPGTAAGIDEFLWLLRRENIQVTPRKKDGDAFRCDETLLELEGKRRDLLSHERVGLNFLQRMSGIATMTRYFQERVRVRNPGTCVVATRKTPWGLLDKRAVHLGGGGTHRLGLWDAIVIKNNHLALLATREDEAARLAIGRVWAYRKTAAFIEVEVRSKESALAAARTFRHLRESDPPACPCLLMLDNTTPERVALILEALRSENLWEHVLIEASGNISEKNVDDYAACGVDAISIGALTHSPRALDLCQRLEG